MLEELVEDNRQRIQRAHENERDLSVQKVVDQERKLQEMRETRRKVQLRRTAVMRTCLLEKSRLQDDIQRLKGASTQKMNKFLEQMGCPPVGGNKKDDEEG